MYKRFVQSDFDLDDLVNVMKGYLDEEDMLSMDFVTLPLEEETGIEIEYEEAGTITYEDVIYTNELLKGEDADFSDREIGTATVVFGELPELVYVGDSFELQVLINTDSSEELIDGLKEESKTDMPSYSVYLFSLLLEAITRLVKFICYVLVFVLTSIGLTIMLNQELRELVFQIFGLK